MLARWLAQLTASTFNRLGQYAAVLETGPTVRQNCLHLLWQWPWQCQYLCLATELTWVAGSMLR